MPSLTMEERLAAAGRKIDSLQERASARRTAAATHVQQQLDAIKKEQASARSAVRKAGIEAEEKLSHLDARLDIAEQSLAAELAEDRQSFVNAITKMVGAWDNALERLQTKAAIQRGERRTETETQISELRAKRNAIAESLKSAGSEAGAAWQARKQRVLTAADEVGRKIDELWTNIDGGKS